MKSLEEIKREVVEKLTRDRWRKGDLYNEGYIDGVNDAANLMAILIDEEGEKVKQIMEKIIEEGE